ncbi:MAG: hypothetical protein ACE5I1_29265 [bacterium]
MKLYITKNETDEVSVFRTPNLVKKPCTTGEEIYYQESTDFKGHDEFCEVFGDIEPGIHEYHCAKLESSKKLPPFDMTVLVRFEGYWRLGYFDSSYNIWVIQRDAGIVRAHVEDKGVQALMGMPE